MSLASALMVGNDAVPQLAENAFREALARTGDKQANSVLLYLTSEFTHQAQAVVTAVARVARSTQISGGIAAGVFTERAWVLDRPAAAVMVLTGELSLAPPEPPSASVTAANTMLISGASNHLPVEWAVQPPRCGGSYGGHLGHGELLTWHLARLAAHSSVRLVGGRIDIAVSRGWQILTEPLRVDATRGYDLQQVGGVKALGSLLRHLPPELRSDAHLPLAAVCAVTFVDRQTPNDRAGAQVALSDGRAQPLAIIAGNADQSLTLADRLLPGQFMAWAARTPLATIDDMRHSLARLSLPTPAPCGALVFSCIGRGPYFYDGDDRDVDCLRERFPGLPLIGTYGTGQLAPDSVTGWRRLQNAVVSALISPTGPEKDV